MREAMTICNTISRECSVEEMHKIYISYSCSVSILSANNMKLSHWYINTSTISDPSPAQHSLFTDVTVAKI